VGAEHSYLKDTGRVKYDVCFDSEALQAFTALCALEGILPALESSHALGYLVSHKERFEGKTVIVNLSGRGDKDMEIVREGGGCNG
jgi:tryptophan synthase beta chain